MLEVFQSHNSRDFRQRYNGSYGYYTVPETKKKVLVYMAAIGEEEVQFHDEHQAVYNARADTGVEFEFIPVRKKLFVHKDGLALIERRPARMWARGINPQNTSVYPVGSKKIGSITLSFAVVKAALENLGSVLNNVKLLEEKKVSSIVLSDLFGVVGSELYLYDKLIGSFMVDRNEIKVDEPMFKQEVVDVVERNALRYKVVSND